MFLGFALAGASGLSATASLAALGSFLIGAVAGGLLALEVSVGAALAVAGAIVVSITLAVHALSGSDAAWTRA